MLGRMSKLRHAAVGGSIAVIAGLGLFGVIGGGSHPERFDAKTIVVQPMSDGSIRVTEYVDQDFGHHRRHGYERVIPHEFGRPVDVVASSPDAPDDLGVVDQGTTTRIRIGDPDVTITGQHRYELSYTYPAAAVDARGLALDVVAPRGDGWPGDAETGRFEVVVTGAELTSPRCDTGPLGATGGCELRVDESAGSPAYRALLEPLPEDEGLSIFADVVGFSEPVDLPVPPITDRRSARNALVALLLVPAGLLGAMPIHRWARRRGRNEVYAGGAADAAYGLLPPPRADGSVAPAPPLDLVADDELGDLATIEFVPPTGLEPWEATVLLTERIGDDTVEAWFSGLCGHEAVDLEERDEQLSISSGPRRRELDPVDAELLDRFLRSGDPYVTGTYDASFASAWDAVGRHQKQSIARSGWWKHMAPGTGIRPGPAGSVFGAVAATALVLGIGAAIASVAYGLVRLWPIALAFGVVVPGLIAYVVYSVLLPARSAQGSALALRAESFRRFLHASEGRHVEWAWSNGLLREYSAWAVALGEADAWSRALERANVPAPAVVAAGPMLIDRMGSSVRSSRTEPSSSGGGGGGFSGGGSGGGGGGGSSGSW